MLTAITTIGMDHMDVLGDTIEKSLPIRRGSLNHKFLVTGNIVESALVIDLKAAEAQAPAYHAGQSTVWHIVTLMKRANCLIFENEHGKIKGLKTPMVAINQKMPVLRFNCIACIADLRQLRFQPKKFVMAKKGLLARPNGTNQQWTTGDHRWRP